MNGRRLRLQKVVAAPFRAARSLPVASMFQKHNGSPRRWAPWAVVLAAVSAAGGIVACGASIQAVYEGDVRFEHCMALDAQPDVKPHIRRACWREWISFYTYGQTRDRVRHAQMRIRQLSGVSEFVSGAAPAAGPEIGAGGGSAGAQGSGGAASGGVVASASASVDTGPASTQARCVHDCEAVRNDCRAQCRVHGCEKSCAIAFRGCVTDCVR